MSWCLNHWNKLAEIRFLRVTRCKWVLKLGLETLASWSTINMESRTQPFSRHIRSLWPSRAFLMPWFKTRLCKAIWSRNRLCPAKSELLEASMAVLWIQVTTSWTTTRVLWSSTVTIGVTLNLAWCLGKRARGTEQIRMPTQLAIITQSSSTISTYHSVRLTGLDLCVMPWKSMTLSQERTWASGKTVLTRTTTV